MTGDPFLDNAVADEAAACVRGGIDFEVVPGVSSLTAVPEYAGIDLIHAGGVQFASVTDGKFSKANTAPVGLGRRRSWSAPWCPWSAAWSRPRRQPAGPAMIMCIVTLHGGSTEQITLPTTLDELVAAVKSVTRPGRRPGARDHGRGRRAAARAELV